MQAKAKLNNYEELEFAITLTATVNDWRVMLRQLKKMNENGHYFAWPLSSLTGAIDKTLAELDKTHAASVEKKEES